MHTESQTNVTQLIESLRLTAESHDKECHETEGHIQECPQHKCWEFRRELAARVMYELDLSIIDLGFVADSLLSVEFEEDMPSDNVLDASEVGGEG